MMGSIRAMKCGICGSERLTPLGELKLSSNAHVSMRLKFARSRLLQLRPTFEVTLARACRDCGAVIPFLDPYEHEQLDSRGDELVAESD